MKTEKKAKRNNNMRRSISSGSSYRDVAKRYGVSGKRVFEIVNKPHKKKSRKR